MEVPMLSQDEFFRHLNLQSVHAAAKFHYRHALKERLRASSIALRKDRTEKLSNNEKLTSVLETASPCRLLSPTSSNRLFGRPVIRREARALNFDDYPITNDAKPEFFNGISPIRKPSILTPLIADSRVFRHPGIKRELEERTKINGFLHPPSNLFPVEDFPPKKRAKIELRRCYYEKPRATKSAKTEVVPKKKKDYRVSFRLQSTSSSEAVEWERKMAAALTLFGHPRKSDVFSTFPCLLLNGSHRGPNSVSSSSGKRSPSLPPSSRSDALTSHKKESAINGNNNNNDKCRDLRLCLSKLTNGSVPVNLSPTVKLEKLSLMSSRTTTTADATTNNSSLSKNFLESDIPRGSRPLLHRRAKDEPLVKPPPPPPLPHPVPDKRKVEETPKVAENNFECPICQKSFSSGKNLLLHGEQVHLKCQSCGLSGVNSLWKKRLYDDLDTCQTCRSKRRFDATSSVTPIVTRQHQQAAMSTLELIEQAIKNVDPKKDKVHKCDICSKVFDRRSRMIRHMTCCHASDIHKVDLSKFAYNSKKLGQSAELGVC